MAGPIVPEFALAPLKAMSEAGLTHTAQFESPADVRQPNGEYVKGWTAQDPIPAHLQAAGSKVAELAAAQGIKADWTIRVKLGSAVVPGMRAMLRGRTAGKAWQRLVYATGNLSLTSKVRTLVTAVDVELDQ